MELDRRRVADAAAAACVARSPPGQAEIASAQTAATGFRIPPGNPAINRLVQNAGQRWPDNSFSDDGASRCQVKMEQALRGQAQWSDAQAETSRGEIGS
jgi:hypothetical protein